METTVEEGARANILHVRGEIDLVTAPLFLRQLTNLATQGHPVVLNMSTVEYLDLSGVRALEGGYRAFRANGLRLAIVASTYPVHLMMALTDIEKRLPVFASLPDAIAFAGERA